MKFVKVLTVIIIILSLALPSIMAKKPPRGVKPADAYIKAVKIAMLASPPRHTEALGFLDTILTFHGSYPEAYFYKGNIFAEFANNTYNITEKLDYIAKMSSSYDSMTINCNNDDLKKKFKKKCKDFSGLVDSIGEYYWRENFNQGVQAIQRYDELKNEIPNAADDEKEYLMTNMDAVADSAKTFFNIAALVHSENYRSYEGLGLIFDRQGEYDSSLTYYIKASEMVPDSMALVQNIAYGYIQKQNWENSIVWFKKYLDKIPEDNAEARVGIMTNIAICFSNAGMADSSYLYNTRVLELNPEQTSAYLDIGRYFLQKSSDVSESIKAAQQDGDDEGADELIVVRDAVLDSSAAYLKVVFEKEPDNALAVEQYGVVCMVRGKDEEAHKAYEVLTQLEPGEKNHWISLGDCRIRMEQFEEAIAPYEKAVEIDPDDLTIWELLVDLYKTYGQPDKATDAQKKVDALKS